MLFPRVLIRRYTPPTCTLELWGNRSPLYLWTGQNKVRDLGFELRFDDPKKPTEDQITVKGNRTQLQLLYDVVNHHIQTYLQTDSSHLPVMAGSTATLTPTIALPSLPALQTKGLLTHELSFGSLTVEPPQSSITLTASQLYDLANALEEYSTDPAILPAISKPQWRKIALTWAGTAAAAFLIALGVGTASIKFRESIQQAANRPNPNPKPSESIVKDVIPPVPPPPTGTPLPSPSVPPSLAQRQPLPTPSTVTTLPSPPRNPSVVTVVPSRPVLPPPPIVPAPNSTAIVITPQTGQPSSVPPSGTGTVLPPPVAPKATQNVPPQVFNPNPPAPNIPELPPLAPSAANSEARDNAAQSNKAKPSLLDIIPQVAEAREYFQARWKPPESLKQTLEYRLVLNQDGSIGRIVPLGQASKIYLDRTSMPLVGESFVSPLEVAGNPQLRLVLSPDGTVRTFMEE